MNHNLTDGSAISFTPATPGQYEVVFEDANETYPVIGFAVILRSCEGRGPCDTEINPVILAEGQTVTAYEYSEGAGATYTLRQA